MSKSRRDVLKLAMASPLILAARPAFAATAPIYANDGIAVDGSDVVGYFKMSAPTVGKAEISHDWMGATWQFSSEENKALFVADPEAYAPQYGGYCAYAVSENYTASTVPDAWTIVDGKLYLNFSRRIRRRWERDIPGRIAAADMNWPAVLG